MQRVSFAETRESNSLIPKAMRLAERPAVFQPVLPSRPLVDRFAVAMRPLNLEGTGHVRPPFAPGENLFHRELTALLRMATGRGGMAFIGDCGPRVAGEVPEFLAVFNSQETLASALTEFAEVRTRLSQPMPRGMMKCIREAQKLSRIVFGKTLNIIPHHSLESMSYFPANGIASYDPHSDQLYIGTRAMSASVEERHETYVHEFRHRAVRMKMAVPFRTLFDLPVAQEERIRMKSEIARVSPPELLEEEIDAYVTGMLAALSFDFGYDFIKELILA